ncbi:MAG: hypothetical protein JWO80_128 [Bryobacterales bacterium]|nr:hypothetical protein [Bryobacterales bacterium]
MTGLALAIIWAGLAAGQGSKAENRQPIVETFTIYTEHPRLFLRPNRLRLLRRERERKSLRWEQFELLMKGGAPMPEPGFAQSLYYRITDDKPAGRKAVAWALNPANNDGRQLALVFDWCQELLTDAEKRTLSARLEKVAKGPAAAAAGSFEAQRSRLLAAIALGDHSPETSAATLKAFIDSTWEPRVAALRDGRNAIARSQLFPLYEILHAIRDNLNADLREQYPRYFKELGIEHLLAYYPASYPAAENEFHIQAATGTGEPDLKQAALARAAELEMVAYDANAPESQVLQGWLMNDRFLMRGTFGNPYELLWANPYQPGLSYYHVPLVFHDELFGSLFVRANWEDSADWLGYFDGQLQLFQDGKVTILNPDLSRPPIDLEEAIVFFGRNERKFQVPAKEINDAFIVGLEPNRLYQVEIDDEELREERSGPGGILYFPGLKGGAGIRFKPM